MLPSPGTTYSENPAYGWVFAFLGMEIRSPISGLTSYNEKARFSLAQRPALRRSAAHLWAWVNIRCEFEQCSIGGVGSISHMVLAGKLSGASH